MAKYGIYNGILLGNKPKLDLISNLSLPPPIKEVEGQSLSFGGFLPFPTGFCLSFMGAYRKETSGTEQHQVLHIVSSGLWQWAHENYW